MLIGYKMAQLQPYAKGSEESSVVRVEVGIELFRTLFKSVGAAVAAITQLVDSEGSLPLEACSWPLLVTHASLAEIKNHRAKGTQ